MPQQHVKICQNQITGLQLVNEELEQNGRRLCVRIDGVPTVDNETSDEVLDNVKYLIQSLSPELTLVVSMQKNLSFKSDISSD